MLRFLKSRKRSIRGTFYHQLHFIQNIYPPLLLLGLLLELPELLELLKLLELLELLELLKLLELLDVILRLEVPKN